MNRFIAKSHCYTTLGHFAILIFPALSRSGPKQAPHSSVLQSWFDSIYTFDPEDSAEPIKKQKTKPIKTRTRSGRGNKRTRPVAVGN